jgi:hypothetical protein
MERKQPAFCSGTQSCSRGRAWGRSAGHCVSLTPSKLSRQGPSDLRNSYLQQEQWLYFLSGSTHFTMSPRVSTAGKFMAWTSTRSLP